jgi:hypothetical protein
LTFFDELGPFYQRGRECHKSDGERKGEFSRSNSAGGPSWPSFFKEAEQDFHVEKRYFVSATHGRNPSRRNIHTMGHQFVMADWNKFKPTKAVNASQ